MKQKTRAIKIRREKSGLKNQQKSTRLLLQFTCFIWGASLNATVHDISAEIDGTWNLLIFGAVKSVKMYEDEEANYW